MSIARLMQQAASNVGPVGAWDLSYAYLDTTHAWDISTAAFVRLWLDISAEESTPTGMFIRDDGLRLYTIGSLGDAVDQYNMSSLQAWNIDLATYNQTITVSGQESVPQDVFFKPDGTKMYVIGTVGDDVNEYDLGTAWNISTRSYLQNFSVSTQETTPTGIFFKPDGTKMYVIGTAGDDVNEYDLSTAWDITTATYLQNFSVATQEDGPTGIFFKSDGTKMYIAGNTGDDVNEYSLSSAWDVSTSSFVQNFSVAGEDTVPAGIFFKPDGLIMYIIGSATDTVYQYVLGAFSVEAQDTAPQDIFFKPDGTKMYILGGNGDDVNEYDLSIAWDITTATYLQNFSVATQDTEPTGVFFKSDGTKMYIVGQANDDVYEYSLSTAWDVSSATYTQNFSITGEGAPTGIFFRPDGTKMYVIGSGADNVKEYTLSSSWDVSTKL
jgi:DNA-binding beta-propeller fold protein YncE